MSYQVLARKWRPKFFADVVGQEYVLIALMNSLSLRRIHHAWLFSGIRGVGKTSIARLLAKSLSCEAAITPTPCGICNNCREIEQGCFIDLIEIDAASRTKVEDTRDLLNNVQYVPTRGRFKIYLIDEVHMLSRHSFSALLKTLEEPPGHVKFLLVTSDPQKLPITILSRCLQFHLRALNVEQICRQLQHILTEEKISHDLKALYLLARAAEGSLRDALNLTDQAIVSGEGKVITKVVIRMLGMLDNDQALSLLEAIVKANGERVMMLVNDMAAFGIEWEALLIEMQRLLYHIAMMQSQLSSIILDGVTVADEQRLCKLAHIMPSSSVQLYYQILLTGRKELPFAPDHRIGVEMILLRILISHPEKQLLDKKFHSSKLFVTPGPLAALSLQSPQKTTSARQELLTSKSIGEISAAQQKLYPTQRIIKATSKSIQKNKFMVERRAKLINNNTTKCLPSVRDISQKQLLLASISMCKEQVEYKASYKRISTVTKRIVKKNIMPTMLKTILQREKRSELLAKLAEEVIVRDAWAAEISKLRISNLAKQVALNSWKEQKGDRVWLHLRPGNYDFSLLGIQNTLTKALIELYGFSIKLTIIKDDSFEIHTPLEWLQVVYEEKLTQVRNAIITDNHIQTLRRFFDAELDEESICLF